MKVIESLVWSFLLMILLLNLYSFLMIKVLGNEMAVIGGMVPLEVVSGSMEPTINIGDMIVIDTDIEEYGVDDIITFRDVNGSFVTHRIVEVTKDGFVTKGDNNDSKDEGIVKKDDIVGVYCFRIKWLGILVASIKNPLTFIIVLIIGIILCILASTDKEGNPIDVSNEYIEFLDYKSSNNEEKNKIKMVILNFKDKIVKKIKELKNKNNKEEKVRETNTSNNTYSGKKYNNYKNYSYRNNNRSYKGSYNNKYKKYNSYNRDNCYKKDFNNNVSLNRDDSYNSLNNKNKKNYNNYSNNKYKNNYNGKKKYNNSYNRFNKYNNNERNNKSGYRVAGDNKYIKNHKSYGSNKDTYKGNSERNFKGK